jgi:hypothetical protein
MEQGRGSEAIDGSQEGESEEEAVQYSESGYKSGRRGKTSLKR